MQSEPPLHPFFAGLEQLTQEQFRTEALRWLHSVIGFDGVVAGAGMVAHGGRIELRDCFLEGRPGSLLECSNYSAPDNLLRDFVLRPEALRNIRVDEFCSGDDRASLRAHLEAHRVRHILLKGIRQTRRRGLAWLGFLRADSDRPFEQAASPAAEMAISVVLHAFEFTGAPNCRLGLPASPVAAVDETAGRLADTMTKRQKQVLDCLLLGWPNKLIARRLAISENTLKSHLQAIYQSMNVSSRSEAIVRAGGLSRRV